MSTVTHYGWYLGNFAALDGNLNAVLGTYGSGGSPINDQAMSFTTTSNDFNADIAENNLLDTMSFDTGSGPVTTQMEELALYNVTATLDDGSVITIQMWAMQSTNGDVILLHDAEAEKDPMETNTVVSFQITSSVAGNYSLTQSFHAEPIDMVPLDGTVDGEAGDDTISLGYDDSTGPSDGGGDQVSNDGNIIEGQGGSDSITAGSGNDTIYGDFADQAASYLITNTGDLFLYEPESGSSTLLQSGLEPYGDIATTPDGSLFGVVFNEVDLSNAGIYEIDPVTGAQTLVIDLPEGTELHSSLAADGNGGLYVSNDNAGTVTYYPSDGAGGFLAGVNAGTIPIPATDILILDDDTAWVTANGVIYQYDIDGSGNFTNETNLGMAGGDTDVFGLSLSADGQVLAYEGTGEVWSTDPTSLPLTWSSEPDAELDGGMIWGTANAVGTGGADTISGGLGDDVIAGGDGADSLLGGAGDDTLSSWSGAATMDGGDDSDTFLLYDSGGGSYAGVTIVGGEGGATDNDTIDLSALSGAVFVDFTGHETGIITNGADTISFSQIESLILTGQNDTVDATVDASMGAMDLYIDAGGGDDLIETWGVDSVGNSNVDTIHGGTGHDTISSGGADDLIYGGDGDDLISSGFANDGLGDTVYGGAGNDTINTVEGSTGTVSGVGDYVDGGSGDDSITGSDDTGGLFQGDTLIGGTGHDTISALAGDDSLTGGQGNDSLTGGDGDDTFNYSVGDGADTITDFNFGNSGSLSDGDSGNNDFIDLSAFYDDIWELHADLADDGVLNQSNDGVDGVDYSDNTQFAVGDSLSFTGASADGSSFTVENTGVICFAKGTMIRCAEGEVAIEELRPGDLVQTMDRGLCEIVNVERSDVPFSRLKKEAQSRPVWISPKLTGGEVPLIVSPQHGLMLPGRGGTRALIKAGHLARMEGGQARVMLGKRQVSYFHLMLERHEILFANGMPAESFYPGRMAVSTLGREGRARLVQLFPDLVTYRARHVFGPRVREVAKWKDLPEHIGDLIGSRVY
ncbi:Bifunctional hemolysin/adenylate cyclase precursor [Pelagimonas phthalicica]|uniref:Bifunctional hemolysin/adenylate cyclase n=1 Tax=Pelagimonas phthalicica TaxID=1037362 RepID=A0A238JBZ1_9RHOB|nr:Hint domain-containing protein [Pelagimonas phthalicica]TDS93799.1 Hint domain-containing protein [Pelagimonas phthalicica]SMX27677.1 Bifunctional hemolysin/adenylate cyclase precursor [Pelagimonas phthalicica]